MHISLAPLEGITGYIVRNAFLHNFGGIDTYYTPFIPAGKNFNKKILRDISSENNEGLRLIPQLMSNRAEEVINMGHQLAAFGYDTVNINLGCPSGTVSSKKRGSGLLLYPEELDHFLYEVYSRADFRVSVKTRIGFHSAEEWDAILDIYRKYPIDELIIHPRVRAEFYNGVPHLDCFEQAYDTVHVPLCYNGDVVSLESYDAITERFPRLDNIMIGRGLLAMPWLAAQIKGEALSVSARKEKLRAFCDEIYYGYLSIFSGEKDAVMHMKEIWGFLGNSFPGREKTLKKIRKCQNYAEYKILVDEMFRD